MTVWLALEEGPSTPPQQINIPAKPGFPGFFAFQGRSPDRNTLLTLLSAFPEHVDLPSDHHARNPRACASSGASRKPGEHVGMVFQAQIMAP